MDKKGKITEWFEDAEFISLLIIEGMGQIATRDGLTAVGLSYLLDRRGEIDAEMIASLVRKHNQEEVN